MVLADKGYAGAGDHIRIPVPGRGKPGPQKDANRARPQLRSTGRRAKAQLKDLAHPAQTPLLPLAPGSWPKLSTSFRPRHHRMKKLTGSGTVAPP